MAADPAVKNTDSRVILKDGSVVHGEVTEPPAHRVTLDAPGKRLVIPTENVHVIEEPPARAFVSFDAGDDAAVLEEERAGNWLPVCTGPCERDLPLDVTYRISGAGVRNSNGFRLNAAPGDHLRLTADTASSTAHTVGMVMLVGSASVGSLAFWLLDGVANARSYDGSADQAAGIAAVTILVTAVLGAVGLGLVLGNQTTSAKQELALPKSSDQASTSRRPTWSERPRSEPERRAPATASLFTLHF
jgi:hypothetical protein